MSQPTVAIPADISGKYGTTNILQQFSNFGDVQVLRKKLFQL